MLNLLLFNRVQFSKLYGISINNCCIVIRCLQLEQVAMSASSSKENKVEVLLRPAGDAPILKKKKWQVDRSQNMGYVIGFLRTVLKCNNSESLFLYVNQSFAPSPDRNVGVLYDCFGADGKLILHYAKTQAWG